MRLSLFSTTWFENMKLSYSNFTLQNGIKATSAVPFKSSRTFLTPTLHYRNTQAAIYSFIGKLSFRPFQIITLKHSLYFIVQVFNCKHYESAVIVYQQRHSECFEWNLHLCKCRNLTDGLLTLMLPYNLHWHWRCLMFKYVNKWIENKIHNDREKFT